MLQHLRVEIGLALVVFIFIGLGDFFRKKGGLAEPLAN